MIECEAVEQLIDMGMFVLGYLGVSLIGVAIGIRLARRTNDNDS